MKTRNASIKRKPKNVLRIVLTSAVKRDIEKGMAERKIKTPEAYIRSLIREDSRRHIAARPTPPGPRITTREELDTELLKGTRGPMLPVDEQFFERLRADIKSKSRTRTRKAG